MLWKPYFVTVKFMSRFQIPRSLRPDPFRSLLLPSPRVPLCYITTKQKQFPDVSSSGG